MPSSPCCSLPVYDVVIIGAGIVGSSTAYQICKEKQAEQKVLLLEQFELLHPNGSSHGNSRITRYSYTDPVYANMGMTALQMWKQAEKESLARVYKPTGGIDFGKKEDPNMKAVIESAKINGYKIEIYEGEQIPKRFPLMKAVPGLQVVYQETSGVLNAYEAVRMMHWLAAKHGCEIHEKEKVLSTEEVKPCSHSKYAGLELVKVTTSKGQYLTKKLVVTAGAWVNKVLGAHKVPNAPLLDVDVQLMSYAFWKAAPKFKAEWNRMPIWINYDNENFDLGAYGFPSLSTEKKGHMKASLHYPLPNERYTNPDARSYEMPKEKYDFMIGFLKKYFREDSIEFLDYETAKKEGKTVTCLYTNSPTTDFIIDTHPLNKNIVVFSGCSGHAFKFGPVIGSFISQLLKDPTVPKFDNKYERSKFSFEKCLLKSKM